MKYSNLQQAYRLIEELSLADQDLLKPFLPALPEQKTLSEILDDVYEAYLDEADAANSDRLDEIHFQLENLSNKLPAREVAFTLEAYENLPDGSIVLSRGVGLPWVKGDGLWHYPSGEVLSDKGMSGVPREIIRKGMDNV